ncbi:MAG: TrbC/VirB2 family protein [Bacteroidales bacterium]|nr:TrbC/VirB2 family protein [Bacteroidales bacterium]
MKAPVRKTFRYRDLLIMAALVAVGILLAFLGPGWRELGYVVIGSVLILSPLFRSGYKIEGHHGVFRVQEIVVPRECEQEICSFLHGDSETLDFGSRAPNGAIVQIFTRKDGPILAQYFDYAKLLAGAEFPIVEINNCQYRVLLDLSKPQ